MANIESLIKECQSLNPDMNAKNITAVLEAESKQELTGVENRTKKQAGQKLWHQIRRNRITASKAHSLLAVLKKNPEAQLTDSIRRILQGQLGLFRIPAVRYGFFQERHAMDAFRRFMRITHSPTVSVQKIGVKVSEKYFELAASPDGLVKCECGCEPALLEIKCPFKIKTKKLQDAKLDFLDSDFNLRKTHKYHTQIQMQMAIFEIPRCYFVVYSPISGVHVQLIEFDAEKWKDNEAILVKFYRDKCLPAFLQQE